MTTRREQILETAAGLFAERGFHGVGVNDIGEACGISGPAIYKHFAGKDDLLAAALTSVSDELLSEGRRRAGDAATPVQALDALIAWHADFALSRRPLIVIQEREWANLPDSARSEVRRTQLAYIDVWVEVVRALRTEWDQPTARAAVQAVFGLLNSTPRSARTSVPAMHSLLSGLARSALLG